MYSFADILNQAGAAFCDFSWAMLVQSSVLIAVLYGVDLFIRRRTRAVVRYGLWMLVLVKLVLPPTLSLPTGIGYWVSVSQPSVESPVVQTQPSPVVPVETRRESIVDRPAVQQTAVSSPPASSPTVSTAEPVTAETGPVSIEEYSVWTWQGCVLCVWILGVVAIVVLLCQRLWFVRQLQARSRPADQAWDELLGACAAQVGLRGPVEVRVSGALHSPAACGLMRPVILVPEAIEHTLGQDKLRAVLLHELIHIKRADLWVNLLQTMLQVLYFYHPLLWLANAQIRTLREKAVDETVLTKLGQGHASQYSTTLIDMAELAFKKPHFSLGLVGVVESRKALSGRIKHILSRPIARSARIGLWGAAFILVAALVLLPMAKGGMFARWFHKDRLVKCEPLGQTNGTQTRQGKTLICAKQYDMTVRPGEQLLVMAELYQSGKPMQVLGHRVFQGTGKKQRLAVSLKRDFKGQEKTTIEHRVRVSLGKEALTIPAFSVETEQQYGDTYWWFFQDEEIKDSGDEPYWEMESLLKLAGSPPRYDQTRGTHIWIPGHNRTTWVFDKVYFVMVKMLPMSQVESFRVNAPDVAWVEQLPDGTYLPADATKDQRKAVADEYVLNIKRMLMRDRMPLPELITHSKYLQGESIQIRYTSPFQAGWEPTLGNIDRFQYDRGGLMFCLYDGKEYNSNFIVGPFGNGGMNLKVPGELEPSDIDMSPGKHTVAYGWRHVDVVDPCRPEEPLHFDRLVTDTVEFEIVESLPGDYYRPTFESDWDETLRQGIEVAFTDDMPRYGVSGPLLGLVIDRLPFDIAFDIFAQAEGSDELFSAGSTSVVSGNRSYKSCDHHVESLTWETVGDERWRLILKPSVEVAKAHPPIREFYGREFVTDWTTFEKSERFEQNYQTYLRRQRDGKRDRWGGTLKADRPVDLDRLTKRKGTEGPVWPLPPGFELGWSMDDGGTVKIDPDSGVRMLWFPEANANYINPSQDSVGRLPELAESPLKEVNPPKGERTLIAVRSSEGRVYWVTVRKVSETWASVSWCEHEEPVGEATNIPAAEGLSAEIEVPDTSLTIGDSVEIDVAIKNTGDEPVTLYCPVIYQARHLELSRNGQVLRPEETGVVYDIPHPKANYHTLEVGGSHRIQIRGRVAMRTLPMRRGEARTQPTLTLDFHDTAFDLVEPGPLRIQLHLAIGQREVDTAKALGLSNLVRGLVVSNSIKLTVTQATRSQLNRAIDRLNRGTEQEKRDAMAVLAANRDRQAVGALMAILRRGPGPVFRDSFDALSAIGDTSVLPELTGMYLKMVDPLQNQNSDHVTAASLVLALIERLQPEPSNLIPFHQKVWGSQVTPRARAEAGLRLARMGDEPAVDGLVKLLHAGPQGTQRLILRSIRWGGGGREMPAHATEKLAAAAMDVMRSAAPLAVRREAVKELALAMGDQSVPILIEALKDPDLWVGLTAAVYLRGRGTVEAIAPLEDYLERADTDQKRRAAQEAIKDIRQRNEAGQ